MILPLIVLDDTPYLAKDPNHAFSVADLYGLGEKARARTARQFLWRCAPTCTRIGSADPSVSSARRFRLGRSRPSNSSMNSAVSPPPVTNCFDTDTTDNMRSETYLLEHGHYQIEVMANLEQACRLLARSSW